jgi:putative transposase
MSNYRRAFAPGGTFFFTVVTYRRQPWLIDADARAALREAFARCRETRPFVIDAWVLLPNHMHTVWTLPTDDANFSMRWAQIKRTVSVLLADRKRVEWMNDSKRAHRESTMWQRRYYEHTIRDDVDFARCVDYAHANPFKHALVQRVADWPWSTFHRDVKAGIYSRDWMGDATQDFGE